MIQQWGKLQRWGKLLSLLAALTLVAASCGDDSDDGDTTATGSEPEEEEIALPASCEAEEPVVAEGGDEAGAEEGEEAGDDAAATGGDASGELTPVKVGILPIADLAPLYYGIDEGYFEDEGLEVSTEVAQGGAALVPAVLTDEYQFAFGNYVSLMLARQGGAGVQIVANIVDGADTPDRGTNALLVDPEKIGGIEDLAGKTFAVTTLDNVAEVNIKTTLTREGVDVSDIRFVELPFPEMNAAVQDGTVDVAWTAEPFVTIGEGMGLVNVADPMYGTTPSMPLAGIFAAEDWLAGNADVANAFHRAMQRSMEAASDEDAMRDAIVAHTQTEADQVGALALANWDADLGMEKLSCVAELAVMFEVGDLEEPDLDELVWSPEEE